MPKGVEVMHSHSRQTSTLPLRELITEEVRRFLKSPITLVLGLMLIMIISALALGTLWDSRSTLGLP
jgi:hypothetical protein